MKVLYGSVESGFDPDRRNFFSKLPFSPLLSFGDCKVKNLQTCPSLQLLNAEVRKRSQSARLPWLSTFGTIESEVRFTVHEGISSFFIPVAPVIFLSTANPRDFWEVCSYCAFNLDRKLFGILACCNRRWEVQEFNVGSGIRTAVTIIGMASNHEKSGVFWKNITLK